MSEFEKKDKYMIYVKPETIEKADRLFKLDGAKSRSEFIENAINFYAGFVSASDCLDFYPTVIVSAVKGAVDSFENRNASLVFKLAVEQAMMMNLMAAIYNVDEDTLYKLRAKCVSEVKRLNGRISFEDVVRYQKGN